MTGTAPVTQVSMSRGQRTNFGKEGRPEPVVAKISQETLAEMIGTTRSRVSHFMNKFRNLGLISYNGHLEVHSALLSVVLAEQPRSVKPVSDMTASDPAAAKKRPGKPRATK